jgi:hypothetical protein
MKLKITNKITGKSWTEENRNHAWEDLVLEMYKTRKSCSLVYCDIEAIICFEETWYILDECGHWEYLPQEYTAEEVR